MSELNSLPSECKTVMLPANCYEVFNGHHQFGNSSVFYKNQYKLFLTCQRCFGDFV